MDNRRPGPQDAGQMPLPLGMTLVDLRSGPWLVLPAVVGLYVATRAAVAALVGRQGAPTPGRVAVGHWIPIVAVAVAAAASGRNGMALGVAYATAVACLTLSLGIVVASAGAVPNPADGRRAWPLLVASTLLAFLAGLQGHLSFGNTLLLAAQGGLVLAVWRYDLGAQPAADREPRPIGRRAYRTTELGLAVAVCGVAAWFAIHGVVASARTSAASPGVWTAAFLSPLLVLPLLGTGVDLAQRGRPATAASATVGVALLNTCGLVPVVGLVAHARGWLIRTPDPLHPAARLLGLSDFYAGGVRQIRDAVVRRMAPARVTDVTLPFPLAVWRIDVVLLVAISALLIPVAAGRLPLGRRGGVALIAVYVAYVAASVIVGAERR